MHCIHKILGTPSKHIFKRFKKFPNKEFDFKFEEFQGTGIKRLIPHVSNECIKFIRKLLTYDSEARPTCEMALKDPYFDEY